MRRNLRNARAACAAVTLAALLLGALPCPDEVPAAGPAWSASHPGNGGSHVDLTCVCSCHLSWVLAAPAAPLVTTGDFSIRPILAPPVASFLAAPPTQPPRSS